MLRFDDIYDLYGDKTFQRRFERSEERLHRSLAELVKMKATLISMQKDRKSLFAEWEQAVRQEIAEAVVQDMGAKIEQETNKLIGKLKQAASHLHAAQEENVALTMQIAALQEKLVQSERTQWMLGQKCLFMQDEADKVRNRRVTRKMKKPSHWT